MQGKVKKMQEEKVKDWDGYIDKHEYVKGVQCDDEHCYACATQRYRCIRLERLDAESSGLI